MNRTLTFLLLVFAIVAPLRAGDGKATIDHSAARLWEQTCSRCHNLRPAKSLSDAQWEVIVHHMRVRANLTGKQAETIARYLKETN
jgi:cytochrome c553